MSDQIHDEGQMDGDGLEPIEVAQAYVDERAAGQGWRVEELSGDVNFGMVTVLLGRYDEGDGTPVQVETAEGHGQSIVDAVDDALGRIQS